MHILSVINYKGGVGKTTTTANLAAELAWLGYSVLLLDMDPQASLTFSFIRPEEWDKDLSKAKTIKTWFDSINEGSTPVPISSLITTPSRVKGVLGQKGRLDLVASHLGLINVDLELATQLGGASLAASKRNYLKVHRRLADGLRQLPPDRYDIVLIDCPPNFNITTKNAIVASDYILIPAKPDYLSTLGIDYLQRHLKTLVKEFNDYARLEDGTITPEIHPEIIGVVFTMIQITSGVPISTQRTYINQTKQLGVPVLANYFRENKTIFGDAPQFGIPVILNAYSAQTYSSIVSEMEEFVREFLTKVPLPKK
jgi:chromosome partitioning protein